MAEREIVGADVVVAARAFEQELGFFRELGFRIDLISPADSPRLAVVSGHGLSVRIDRDAAVAPAHLRLRTADPEDAGSVISPNGTTVEFAPAVSPLHIPPGRQSMVVSRLADIDGFGTGRAGMQYRDLIPDRYDGRFIASHIRVPGTGPLGDWVHYHDIHFQLIYCYRGAAKLVYEDQGAPFRFEAGDCVLQPPGIRHRVLESFDDLEVVEIGCPAEHDTHADHDLALPTAHRRPGREFGGQRFVHHVAADAQWIAWRHPGYQSRETGLGEASRGAGDARVIRPGAGGEAPVPAHDGDLRLWFVLAGTASVTCADTTVTLGAADSITIPAGAHHRLRLEPGSELLEVDVPGDL